MSNFMEAFSVSEVSKKIDVPVGTLYQWEKDFEGVFHIPRNEKKERIFTEFEIETLRNIKAMRDKNISKAMIKEFLKQNKSSTGESNKLIKPQVQQMKQSEAVEILRDIQGFPEEFKNVFVSLMGEIREELKNEVREEIREELKNELIPQIRREIAKDSKDTQKLLSSNNEELIEKVTELEEKIENQNKKNKQDIARRDEVLLQNMNLLKELKEERQKGFFKRLFK